jgi:hypothetical protein
VQCLKLKHETWRLEHLAPLSSALFARLQADAAAGQQRPAKKISREALEQYLRKPTLQ